MIGGIYPKPSARSTFFIRSSIDSDLILVYNLELK